MNYTPPSELRDLIDKLLDQQGLSRTETAQLEEHLENDDALHFYLTITQQEALIPEAIGHASAAAAPPVGTHTSPKRGQNHKIVSFAKWAAAACIIFGAGWIIGTKNPQLQTYNIVEMKPESTTGGDLVYNDENYPTITGLYGVQWSHEADNHAVIPAPGNLISIDSGLVELSYPSGVKVLLEGPAIYQPTCHESGMLNFGKLVASVPPGAEGFTIDYNGGKVVDIGTEFGIDVKENGDTEVGVFDGLVEMHLPDHEKPLVITENSALLHSSSLENAVAAIPFDQEKFIRNTPSRYFSWDVNGVEMREFEFNVSNLIWKGTTYRAIFKWMKGKDAIDIYRVSLHLDGKPIVTNNNFGCTGGLKTTKDNIFNLELPDLKYRRGKWTVKALVAPKTRDNADDTFEEVPPQTSGMMKLVEGIATSATKEDFIGAWQYVWEGRTYIRDFTPEGRIKFYINGKLSKGLKTCTWTVEDGVMKMWIPHLNTAEDVILLDENTMMFTDQPYGNAVRVPSPDGK